MPFQIPKADHPWRQYTPKPKSEEEKHVRPVQTVVHELTESWSNIEITTTIGSKRYLSELPQSKQAVWLINFIRRNYLGY